MTEDKLEKSYVKTKLLELVNKHGPMLGTHLIAIYIENMLSMYGVDFSGNVLVNGDKILAYLDELVEAGQIVEVEYVLRDIEYHTKSMYFPAGTSIHIVEYGRVANGG